MTALIALQDPQTRHRVRDQLQDRGLAVSVAASVAEARAAVAGDSFRVVIVDLDLPDGSGLEVLDALRASGSAAHVIVLSGSATDRDRVQSLIRGADEFVVKPFRLEELTASAVAVRRRPDPDPDASLVHVGHCAIDVLARQVICGGEIVDLTAKEFDLFAYLAMRPGNVFSREHLLNAVWRSASEWQQPATVTEHIRRLRNKIELDSRRPVTLITVRGAGYRLDLPTTGDAGDHATVPDPVGEFIHVDGRIVFADDAAGDVAGFTAAAMVGMHVLDLVAPTSLIAATERLADGAAGRPRRSEVMQLLRADREQVTVSVRSTPTDWHGARAGRVQLTPLSDAPAQLRRLVTGVLSEVTDAVIITDAQCHIRSWNAAAERIYGWAEGSVLGRHVLDILNGDGDVAPLVIAQEQLERTGHWSGALTQTTRDGSTVDVLSAKTVLHDDAGEPIGAVSVDRLARAAAEERKADVDAALVARIAQGMADDEFVVHYQPIVDLVSGDLLAVEALVRWEHPERGCLAPAAFLDAAEQSGLIVALGEIVLDKACRQAVAWRRSGADVVLAVNVSARQLASSGLADRFTAILRAAGCNPAHLWLEVTETAVVEEFERASQALCALVALGVGVSIDDFGTGWASLTYLQTFPVHALKIDGTFVAGAGRNGNDTVIVRAILSLGAELGLHVIAEGIETAEQRDFVRAMGATLGQGYLYGRPLPAAEVPLDRARRLSEPAAPEAQLESTAFDAARPASDTIARLVGLRGPRTAALVLDRPTPTSSSRRLLELAAEGRARQAVALVLGLLADGTTPEHLIVDLLAPLQRLAGEQWQRNRWSVADEHAATVVIDAVLGALASESAVGGTWRGEVVVACAEGEHHTVPARMGAEILRAQGWGVTFLGGSVPAHDLQHFAAAREPNAVIVSCTVPWVLPGARRSFAALAEVGLPALAAGAAFGHDDVRALRVGARGWLAPGRTVAELLDDDLPLRPHVVPTSPEALALGLDREELQAASRSLMVERVPLLAILPPAQSRAARTHLEHFFACLTTAVDLEDDEILEQFVAWLSTVLTSRDVPPAVLTESVACIGEVLDRADLTQAARLCGAPAR